MTELTNRIDHVVIIVKENHTFDNYFGTFPGANGVQLDRVQDPRSFDPDHGHQAWEQRADWGGWFDHVEPPNAEQWDIRKAQRLIDWYPQFSGQQFRYGSRVPCLAISPYAKPDHVSTTVCSHISLVKFVQTLLRIDVDRGVPATPGFKMLLAPPGAAARLY